MTSQDSSKVAGAPRPVSHRVVTSRNKAVAEGEMPISEFLFDRAGAASPFGDDITFPMAAESVTYQHPSEESHRPAE
jgi:hypothetical protein